MPKGKTDKDLPKQVLVVREHPPYGPDYLSIAEDDFAAAATDAGGTVMVGVYELKATRKLTLVVSSYECDKTR